MYLHISLSLSLSLLISFDVRVMQQGRMKGQAFIGMPNEEIASKALSDTLGYKLYDKPMVVVRLSSIHNYLIFLVFLF